MRMRNRLFLIALLVPAWFPTSGTDAMAQSVSQSNWSDPNTWPNRKVPVAGDKVVIARDKDVVLDVRNNFV